MPSELTPAAQNALNAAATWRRDHADALSGPELLMGLLAEAECRAAQLLIERGVGVADISARWPDLAGPAPVTEGEVAAQTGALARTIARRVEGILDDVPGPITLATEHLLLGIAAAEDEASRWLADRGVTAQALATTIRELYGYRQETAPLEIDGEQSAPIEQAQAASGTARSDDSVVWRILDASANRAREGVRVVEDFVRFALDDPGLTSALKRLRHELASALATLPIAELRGARHTEADVGTEITLTSERERNDIGAVAVANLKRAQEALRSLEEFGKLVSADFAQRAKQLRYKSYTIEQQIAGRIDEGSSRITAPLPGVSGRGDRSARLAAAQLYVLVDGCRDAASFAELARSLIEAGVDVLQLRDKRLADAELLARARLLRELTLGTPTLFVMNDRPDLAALAGADGVHVGQEELSVDEARAIIGPDMLVGVSTHSIEQARRAVADGADYIGVGPTFPSATKQFDAFTGVALLRSVAGEIALPAFAIGGVALENLDQVLAAGMTRVAVSSAIAQAQCPAATAREFRRRLG